MDRCGGWQRFLALAVESVRPPNAKSPGTHAVRATLSIAFSSRGDAEHCLLLQPGA